MSTKAIREAMRYLDILMEEPPQGASPQEKEIYGAALSEVEAIERAAKDLTRMSLGDGVYRIRDSQEVLSTTPDGQSTWDHPDVKAWGDASEVLRSIAEQG